MLSHSEHRSPHDLHRRQLDRQLDGGSGPGAVSELAARRREDRQGWSWLRFRDAAGTCRRPENCQPQSPEGRYVRVVRISIGDVRLYFEAYGQARRIARDASAIERFPVLVGLHGGPGSDGGKLRFLLPHLADVAQVLVPDQRGHGLSDPGAPRTWNLAQWAADVKAFADALEVDRPVVLGESFGGFVAQEYAGTYPEQPAGLILVSCGSRFATPAESAGHVGGASGPAVGAVLAAAHDPDSDAEDWARVIEPLLAVQSDPLLDRLEQLRVQTMDVNRHFEPEGFAMDLRPRLANVRCPTLLIVGESDPLVPPALAHELIDALPAGIGRLAVIKNASHRVLTHDERDVWKLIRSFISDLQ